MDIIILHLLIIIFIRFTLEKLSEQFFFYFREAVFIIKSDRLAGQGVMSCGSETAPLLVFYVKPHRCNIGCNGTVSQLKTGATERFHIEHRYNYNVVSVRTNFARLDRIMIARWSVILWVGECVCDHLSCQNGRNILFLETKIFRNKRKSSLSLAQTGGLSDGCVHRG